MCKTNKLNILLIIALITLFVQFSSSKTTNSTKTNIRMNNKEADAVIKEKPINTEISLKLNIKDEQSKQINGIINFLHTKEEKKNKDSKSLFSVIVL